MQKTKYLAAALLVWGGVAQGQTTTVEVEQLPCLLVQQNSVVSAKVRNDVPGSQVRLYFRRLHEEVEDFYWTEMRPRGAGEYWGIFPKPDEEILERRELADIEQEVRERWARWWRQKHIQEDRDPNDDLDPNIIAERAAIGRTEPRDWMGRFDDRTLEEWLDALEYEPTEYLAAVHDGFGNLIAQSPLHAVQVRSECLTNLTPIEAGLAENLTVGETALWQQGEQVFHWLCDGVVSRVDRAGVWRGDDICRACVVAFWRLKSFLIPIAAGATGTGVILTDDPPEASPSRP